MGNCGKITKQLVIFSIVASLLFAFQRVTKSEEPTTELSYVERIQKTAETLEIFPVDLIARGREYVLV